MKMFHFQKHVMMFQVHILFVTFFLIAQGASSTNETSTASTIGQLNINGTTSDMKANSLFMSPTETTAKPMNNQNTNSTASNTNGNIDSMATVSKILQLNINGTTSDMKGNSLLMSVTETTAKPVNHQNTNSTASNTNGNFDFMSTISKLLPSSGGDVTKQAGQALQYLKFMFIGDDPQHIPGSACLNDVTEMLQGVLSGEQWAIRMLDAFGKPESGIFEGNLKWLGSYDECVTTIAAVNKSGTIIHPWKGQYCTTQFSLDKVAKQVGSGQALAVLGDRASLAIGVCMPNSCTGTDITILMYKAIGLLKQDPKLVSPVAWCQKESLEYDTKAIVALIICSMFAFVMTIGTMYDVILTHYLTKKTTDSPNHGNEKANVYTVTNGTDSVQMNGVKGNTHSEKLPQMDIEQAQSKEDNEPGTVGKALLAFSVYTNGKKILNTSQPKGTLTAVNGIRFISMTWVILGHTYAFHISSTQNVGTVYADYIKRFSFQVILNGTLSVDTFFVLSGLLVAYLSLKAMKKCDGVKNFQWGMFYFHRLWRLTPPYMLFMMFYVCLARYLYNGPQYSQTGLDTEKCGKYWWRNMLYINNLFPAEEVCMGWSWYLSNDMQFYVLSPIMLIPLYYSSVFGTLCCLAVLGGSCLATGLISRSNDLPANNAFDRTGNAFDLIYDKPWTRIGAYAVGFLAGYILYRTNCKIKMPKIVCLFGWLVAAAVAIAVLYGLYDDSGTLTLSNTVSALYNATSRSAWGIAVCWVIVACATGNGGFINTLLSWKALIPLSRLTYCAYLVHPVVMYFKIMGDRKREYWSDLEATYLFCGHLCLSYALAFIVSLAFESPMMGLEKALLGRKKKN